MFRVFQSGHAITRLLQNDAWVNNTVDDNGSMVMTLNLTRASYNRPHNHRIQPTI